MATSQTRQHARERVRVSYQLIRNTTSPDEKATGVQSFIVNLPAVEILGLPTKDNLRCYLAEYNPRKRNRVHDAIRNTLLTAPQRFITRNGGIVVTASGVVVDDDAKTVTLSDPSIINGAQTQGEIKSYLAGIVDPENPDEEVENPFFVRVEFIIDKDSSEVVETAIARNTATPVKSISQAGARGQLDELEASIQSEIPNVQIRKKETDEDVMDTRRILQWARLLMPEAVSKNPLAVEKLRAYKNPEQCLTDFCDWYENKETDPDKAVKYDFTVQIAPSGITEYQYWETHNGWTGHHIWEETKKGGRACRRKGKSGPIVWVSPGLVYPIMGAMSEFVEQNANGQWKINKPGRFKSDEMILRAVNQFRAHGGDPMAMGRSEAAYDALRIYPNTLVEVLRDIEAGNA